MTSSLLEGEGSLSVTGVADLETAEECDVSFLDNPRYVQKMHHSKALAVFVSPHVQREKKGNYLLSPHPSFAFQKAIEYFIPPAPSGFTAIHPTAVIHSEAVVEEGVSMGPYVVVDRGSRIGKGTTLAAHVVIGAETSVGENCLFHPHVVVRERCQIGHRVTLQSGAVIGACGFGYFTDEKGRNHPLSHRGTVILEDDVEIGANTTIDRGRFAITRIKRGSKLDNLVQIAHQVEIGEDNLIVSQVGIAGSTKTGCNVVMGGQVGVIGHVTIADRVILAARAAVSKAILKGGIYSGAPAIPIAEFNEQFVMLRNIKSLVRRLKTLEEKLKVS